MCFHSPADRMTELFQVYLLNSLLHISKTNFTVEVSAIGYTFKNLESNFAEVAENADHDSSAIYPIDYDELTCSQTRSINSNNCTIYRSLFRNNLYFANHIQQSSTHIQKCSEKNQKSNCYSLKMHKYYTVLSSLF